MCRTNKSSGALIAITAFIFLIGLLLPSSPSAWVFGFGKSPATSKGGARLSTFQTAATESAEGSNSRSAMLHTETWLPSGNDFMSAMVAVVFGFLVAVPGAMATIGGSGWEVRNVMPVKVPVPDENPFIRQLQKKSWQMEPFTRQRLFLRAMKSRLHNQGEIGIFQPKYFVHWDENSFKYDILEQKNFNEAMKSGKIRIDADMTQPDEELPVYVYTKPQDQKWTAENLGVFDFVEIPDELKVAIREIRNTPFPSSDAGLKSDVALPVSTVPPAEVIAPATVAKEVFVSATPATTEGLSMPSMTGKLIPLKT